MELEIKSHWKGDLTDVVKSLVTAIEKISAELPEPWAYALPFGNLWCVAFVVDRNVCRS